MSLIITKLFKMLLHRHKNSFFYIFFYFACCLQVSNLIVIAKRGNCNYADKAKFVESSGAAALLVINDDEGNC